MLLIPGILASKFTPQGDFESIATVTVGAGGAANIEFTSIPSTYTHLQVRLIARLSTADTGGNVFLQFNSDTASNYSWHYVEGDGATANAGASANASQILCGRTTAATATAGQFGAAVIDILDYKNTNKYKTTRTLTGSDRNGAGVVRLDSGNWRNTNAITSIKLNPSTDNFVQYSQAALYGIKG
jgi:hypothetical protein